ncbi:MAG: serine kinase [Actinomycetia bacterium]|nr:serine kinase [Actinomycetes bacterium]
MSWADFAVRVRVPATSANLGPGFDALGLALTLYDEVEARVIPSGLTLDVSGEGASEVIDAGEKHLVVRAMRAAFDDLARAGLVSGQPPGIALRCLNRIPHGRGLGSSAAAIVAGVLAARALAGADTTADAALALASELEGHPDNVAPCLYGGLTVAWVSAVAAGDGVADDGVAGAAAAAAGGSRVRAIRLESLPGITPVAIIAPEPVSTEMARALLPSQVPHADAARNAGRSALLVAALTARPDALLDATEDWLHQDYRAPAMPATHDLLRRLRAAGIPAVVSGAGPSVLAFLTDGGTGDWHAGSPGGAVPNSRALASGVVDSTVREAGIGWHVSPLAVERQGASVAAAVLSGR